MRTFFHIIIFNFVQLFDIWKLLNPEIRDNYFKHIVVACFAAGLARCHVLFNDT